jgi:hypothetical protein
VSWDAFDATAIEEEVSSHISSEGGEEVGVDDDANSDYQTAVSTCSSHNNDQDRMVVGRKRDRKSFRAEQRASSSITMVNDGPSFATSPNNNKPAAATTSSSLAKKLDVPPVIIPSYSWEIYHDGSSPIKNSISTNTLSSFVSTTSTLSSPLVVPNDTTPTQPMTFDQLMNDMHLAVFSYLDVPSLQSVMAVNTHYRQLVLSKDAVTSVWMSHCKRAWKTTTTKWLDRFHLPTAASETSDSCNIPLLLSITPSKYPTGVDSRLVDAQNQRTERLRPQQQPPTRDLPSLRTIRRRPEEEAEQRRGQHHREQDQQQSGHLRHYQDEVTGHPLIQYTGPIGVGDRCIRSNHPLPRPVEKNCRSKPTTNNSNDSMVNPFASSRPFLANLWRRGANRMIHHSNDDSVGSRSSSNCKSSQLMDGWKPFVMPFRENSTTVNVTPRFISYYEVSILDNTEGDDDDDDDDDINGPVPTPAAAGRRSDCVAVGIASESFHVHTRMPGWDRQSFGFHGDDGGIFHSSGGMVKQFGPKFGAGDTIGCGIDYVNQGIFFTLNGIFLGYGWTGVDEEFLKHDLYPVVGLDTNSPLFLNFGAEEPFEFDLSSFIMKHEDLISSQYSFDNLLTASSTSTQTTSIRSLPSTSSLASSASSASTTSSNSTTRRHRRFQRRSARERK